MRNRYAMVLRTYLRWDYAWVPVAVAFWIIYTVFGSRFGEVDSFPLGRMGALAGFFFLSYVACLLNGHLIGMIGSARGRVTPGLAEAHLLVAAAIAGVLTIAIPLGQSLAVYGWHGPHLAVIALALAVFSITCFLPYWNRLAAALWSLLPFVAIFLRGTRAAWVPTNAEVLVLFLISFACLFRVADRCLHLELAEVAFRGLVGMDERRVREALGTPFRGLWRFAPDRLRRMGRGGCAADEGLWQRAKHWDAAWWNIQTAAMLGTAGGILFALMAYQNETAKNQPAPAFGSLIYILLPFCACLPFAWVLNPPWRTYWINEFLRPYSRRQHVGAAGFALAVASLVGSCLFVAIPFIALWIVTGVCPATRETLCAVALSLCGAPLFFALCAANWPPFRACVSLVLVLTVYAVVIWKPMLDLHSVSNVGFATRAIGLMVFGGGLTVGAYRSWLNHDIG